MRLLRWRNIIVLKHFRRPSMKILSGNRRVQTISVITLLLAILAGAVFVGHYGWVSAGDVTMPAWGWLMMGLGIVFSLLVGGGLMGLVFYSSRAGFDEPPDVVQKKHRAAKWTKILQTRKKRRSS
jgi:hypothetical protein